jgi:hypothetical protein
MTGFAHSLAALLLALAAATASAQVFKWVDENGRVHYGEKPPPGATANAVKPPAEVPNAPAQPRNLQSQELEFRGRQIKKREDEARQAQETANREAYCDNAKERLANAEQAVLYRREKGERVFLSDTEQKAEIESRRAAVTRYCR